MTESELQVPQSCISKANGKFVTAPIQLTRPGFIPKTNLKRDAGTLPGLCPLMGTGHVQIKHDEPDSVAGSISMQIGQLIC